MEINDANAIYFLRGDTDSLEFTPMLNDEEVTDAVMTFSVKTSTRDKAYLIQKQDDNGVFYFEEADTKDLPGGKYIYDIEVRSGDVVKTFGPFPFILIEDVTKR